MSAFPLTIKAQPSTMVWGAIPAEQITLDQYPPDPSAAAVILGSIRNLDIGANMAMLHEEHHRYKLFSEAAYDLATVTFDYDLEWNQQLELVEGQTFIPGSDGVLERVVLRQSEVFEEREGSRVRITFTLPALQPGAIVEYRFRITSSEAYWLQDWRFQHRYPTLWSELRMRYPAWISVHRHPIGNPEFYIEEVNEEDFQAVRRGTNPGTGLLQRSDRPNVQLNTTRWVMKDVPAAVEEPYVASILDHTFGMRLEYVGFFDRHNQYQRLAHSWEDVVERLLEQADFGRRLRTARDVRDQVAEVIDGADSDDERVERIYGFVRRSMVWNGEFQRGAQRPLHRVLETRTGTSAELNLLLVSMLREAGISSAPVLLSTRANGAIEQSFPSARQFNHVVASIDVGRDTQLLDATDPNRPIGMLPLQALNGRGLLVAEGSSRWVRLEPPPSTVTTDVTAEVHPDGRISGIIEGRASGYPALDLRRRIEVVDETDPGVGVDERGQTFVEMDGFRFTRSDFVGLDDDGDITYELEFETDAAGRVMEHLLTFNPILFGRLERNPFESPERSYPIDFGYPFTEMYTARFTLPEGYELDEVPERTRHSTEGNYISYTNMVTSVGGRLEVRRMYGRRGTVFYPREYATLREVYDGISVADGASIVLARSEDSPASVDEGDDGM